MEVCHTYPSVALQALRRSQIVFSTKLPSLAGVALEAPCCASTGFPGAGWGAGAGYFEADS